MSTVSTMYFWTIMGWTNALWWALFPNMTTILLLQKQYDCQIHNTIVPDMGLLSLFNKVFNSVYLQCQVSVSVLYFTWYTSALWDWNGAMHSHCALYSEKKNALKLLILVQFQWFKMMNLCYQWSATQIFGNLVTYHEN